MPGQFPSVRNRLSGLDRSAFLRSGYRLCCCPVSGLVSARLAVGGRVVVPDAHRLGPRRDWSPSLSLVLFVLVRRVVAGRRAAARPGSASFQGQPGRGRRDGRAARPAAQVPHRRAEPAHPDRQGPDLAQAAPGCWPPDPPARSAQDTPGEPGARRQPPGRHRNGPPRPGPPHPAAVGHRIEILNDTSTTFCQKTKLFSCPLGARAGRCRSCWPRRGRDRHAWLTLPAAKQSSCSSARPGLAQCPGRKTLAGKETRGQKNRAGIPRPKSQE